MKLSAQDVHVSIIVFAFLALLSGIPLTLSVRQPFFEQSLREAVAASALFWGAAAVLLGWRFWDDFYRYFYPDWMKPLMPVSALLYSAIGFGLWRLSSASGGFFPMGMFLVLGGAAGVLEHFFAIEGLGILKKVPMLQGLPPVPVLVFSFFEYAFYWSIVGWLSRLLGIFSR